MIPTLMPVETLIAVIYPVTSRIWLPAASQIVPRAKAQVTNCEL